jgi:hypothetical protein
MSASVLARHVIRAVLGKKVLKVLLDQARTLCLAARPTRQQFTCWRFIL